MCEGEDELNWERDLPGILISGAFIFLFLAIIATHLQIKKPIITTTSTITYAPIKIEGGLLTNQISTTLATTSSLATNDRQNNKLLCDSQNPLHFQLFDISSCKVSIQHQMAPLVSDIAGEYLDKLGLDDIFLLILIWPLGIYFNMALHDLCKKLRKKFQKTRSKTSL